MAEITQNPAAAPIATGAIAIGASLTLQEWAWVAGIVGVIIGVFYGWRRDQREERKLEFELGLREDRRVRQVREGERNDDSI